MASNINIDQLANEITQAVQEYTQDVSEGIELTVDDVATQVLMETAMRAPHSDSETGGEYARSFVKTNKSLKSHGYRKYVIWNKKHHRRVHLLEFGHAKVNGGRVRAYPHMVPAYEKYAPQLETRIKRVIQNGGGE